MVFLHIKKNTENKDEFLFQCCVTEKNADMIANLVAVNNLRVRLSVLAAAIMDLGKHGIMKDPKDQGIDHIQEEYEGKTISKNPYYCEDPTGLRDGNGVGATLLSTFQQVAEDTQKYISSDQVKARVCMEKDILEEKLNNLKGAVMMAFPMGLPDYDTVQCVLQGESGLEGTQVGTELLDPTTATLWSAGKEFLRDQLVSDRLGHNEKTKLIVKLQPPGAGPPAREAAITEEERKAMMSHYFKRQEEMKKLSESSEDDYLASSWADSKGLQRNLRGIGDIKAPGVGSRKYE